MFTKLKKSTSEKPEKGFTIIEVMIVLAIAGLILLIVFLAVPALQRNSRNTQRKNDVQAVLGGISTYFSNNNGAAPGSLADIQSEVKTSFYQTADIDFGTGNTAIATPSNSIMYIRIGGKCDGGNVGGTGATSRSVAVVYAVETGSGTSIKCQDS
ncbi:MAG TPA: type II secretion system protein [Candidatus Saccharimonadales bacterium]|nr:type II secretion system protein [Candidatus Saccharimonadales bacterium]